MNSCLYTCRIMHCRIKPKYYKLNHTIFMFYLDLDEIDGLAKKLSLFSHNRANIYNFSDADHLDLGARTVKENLALFLKSRGIEQELGRVMLLTNVKTFGYNFNPVSFYYCFDKQDQPLCVVPEIGNTFRELKPYVIGLDKFDGKIFDTTIQKYFYISPFMDLDLPMQFRLRIPGEKLDMKIDDIQNGEKILYTTMAGEREELTNFNLWKHTFLFPLITLKVIFLIHFHALILKLKGLPHHEKHSNPHLQKDFQSLAENKKRKHYTSKNNQGGLRV
jgi:uncharacterized protein